MSNRCVRCGLTYHGEVCHCLMPNWVTVTFKDGDYLSTTINGTRDEVICHYARDPRIASVWFSEDNVLVQF